MKIMRYRVTFRSRLQLASVFLFLLTVHGAAQTGTARVLAEIDLEPLGVRAPAHGSVSASAMELLFISDSYLALLDARVDEPGNAHLTLYAIGERSALTKKTLNLGEVALPISTRDLGPVQALEWIDEEHFAYWTYSGKANRWVCDTDLKCREDKEGVTPTPPHQFEDCRPQDLLGFIDAEKQVCLVPRAGTKWSAIVMDSSGHHLYEVAQGALPWNASLISSIQGQRFGLEWKSNTALQLLVPLACIDDCPPAGRQQFVVFNSNDGRKIHEFKWDPRPYNLYFLPALSPSGKTAAFVRADKLAIYSLDPVGLSLNASDKTR